MEHFDGVVYAVRHSSRARRSRLTIAETGDVTVVLPSRASAQAALDLVRHNRAWIVRQLERIERRRLALAARPSLAHGRLLSIDGDEVLVRAVDEQQLAALERQLRRRARLVIEARVAARAEHLDVRVARVSIRDQRTRWGSASASGALSFNWRLVLAPPEVLDYVVVHELAHLHIRGHGRSFWQLVAKHHRDPAGARQWLREHQAEVRHALD